MPKLAVGAPGDRFEREADQVASAVMRGSTAPITGTAQQGELANETSTVDEIASARTGGARLDAVARTFFESRFGRDFGDVRIHAGSEAQAMSGSLGARAFTVGNDIYFNRGEYMPGTPAGRRLIAHELVHTVQQANAPAMVMRDASVPEKQDTAAWMKKYFAQSQGAKRLNFFHGTRWSVAQKIPRNVKAVGGGDFAAGFYTHHDQNDKKAWFRTLQWACRVARDAKEKYGGVIKFNVDAQKFASLSGKNFGLTSTAQSDYVQRQDEWIKFITANGRKPDPVFQKRRSGGVWLHERVDPPQPLAYDTLTGPFYKPLPGEEKRKPAPSEFTPFVEGADTLPQQVVFANKGCDLLNDADTKIDLTQHDCATGNIVDPPDTTAAAAAGTPSGNEVPMLE